MAWLAKPVKRLAAGWTD